MRDQFRRGDYRQPSLANVSMHSLQYIFMLAVCVMASLTPAASAQFGKSHGTVMNEPVIGFATAVEPDHITLKDMNGELYDVIPLSNLKIYGKDGKPATLKDLHVGDGFNAQGFLSGKTIRALQAKISDPDMQMKLYGPNGLVTHPQTMNSQAPDHSFAMGNVTSIDAKNITLKKQDGSLQVVTVDDATIFYRVGRASEDRPSPDHPHGVEATFSDLKVGDLVSVIGSFNGNVFLAHELTVMKM
jgi:hypothetical protein